MLNNILTLIVVVLTSTSMLLFIGIEIYINIFQAEKMRQKFIALPAEYTRTILTQYFWAQPYIPFKWWHFYRKAVFSYQINCEWHSVQNDSPIEQKIYELMPVSMRRMYKIEKYTTIALCISGAIYFLFLRNST